MGMGIDTVIIDTAGRLQIDEEMMLELSRVKKAVNPDDTLLVVDAMTGEKVEALQPFYPDRMASRILSMGDVLTLVEKAQEEIDLSDVEQMQSKILEAKFDFNDFLKQMRLMKNMGSFGSILKMIPGMNKLSSTDIEKGEGELKRT